MSIVRFSAKDAATAIADLPIKGKELSEKTRARVAQSIAAVEFPDRPVYCDIMEMPEGKGFQVVIGLMNQGSMMRPKVDKPAEYDLTLFSKEAEK